MKQQALDLSRIAVRALVNERDVQACQPAGATIYIDLETTGLDKFKDDILLIAVADDTAMASDTVYVIDAQAVDRAVLAQWVASTLRGKTVVGHNLAFDLGFLVAQYQFDPATASYYDTMLVEQLCYAGLDVSCSLAETSKRRLGVALDKSVRSDFTIAGISLTERHYRYAAHDVAVLPAIMRQQQRHLADYHLAEVAELEHKLLPVVVSMECAGVPFDKQSFERFSVALDEKYRKAHDVLQRVFAQNYTSHTPMLFDIAPVINIASRPAVVNGEIREGQLWPVLQSFGIEIYDHAGNPSLAADDMLRWDTDHDVPITLPEEAMELIAAYRQYRNPLLNLYGYVSALNKMQTGFVQTLRKMYRNGRLYPRFNQLGASATGRFSGDLQQLPKDDKTEALGLPSLRQCIVAEPGHKLIIADFAGIELVILADMSRDATLCDVIVQSARGEQDIHLYVVRHAFSGLHPDAHKATLADKKKQPFATLRNAAKPVSYGIAYGITGAALSETINHALAPLGIRCTVEQAQQIVDLWKTKLFPAAGRWLEGQAHAGQRLGYVATALGRCRYFDIQQATRKGRAELAAIGRKASNAPIQGTCADMLKLAMVLFADYADPTRAQIVMTVHDELVVHATDDYAQEAASLLKKAMEDAAQALLPVMGRFVVVEPSISDKYDK